MTALGVLLLFAFGIICGRAWQSVKDEFGVRQCPRCAITDRERRTLLKIDALRRDGEEQMRQAADQQTPHRIPQPTRGSWFGDDQG